MSLTAELDSKDSLVTRWFNEWLPNAKPLSTEWNARVKEVPVVRPLIDRRIPGTVGTAFDYRLRYYLALTPIEDLVAATGMRLLDAGGGDAPAARTVPDPFFKRYGPRPAAAEPVAGLIGEFQEALAATLAELAPVGRSLADDQEELLCRYCYLLGLFEELYRAGLRINSPLFALQEGATLHDLLALPPQIWVDDLRVVSRLVVPRLPELAREPIFLNPTFAGSSQIGGADADLITDGCLIDIKTTVDPKFTRTRLLYQLLGYVLLDYEDAYAIRSVGVYLSRQGLLIRWQLDDLLATLLDGKEATLVELRASFRQAAQAAAANAAAALFARAREG